MSSRFHFSFLIIIIILAIQLVTFNNIDAGLVSGNESDSVGLVANLNITTINRAGKESASEAKVYKLGKLVRIEPKGSNIGEVNLYDFEHLMELRVIYSDKIFFERRISRNFLLRAERDGFYKPVDPDITIDKIRLKEDRFDNHPTILYLVVRSLKIGGNVAKDYSMVWEATDLENIPVRIVYPLLGFSTVIVEYRNVAFEKLDPSLFQPPPEFLNLSPF